MIVFWHGYRLAVTSSRGVSPLTDHTEPGGHTKFRHLGWAGVEIEHDGQTLLTDCIKDSFPLIAAEATTSPQPRGASVALVTHLHFITPTTPPSPPRWRMVRRSSVQNRIRARATT